MKNLAGDEKADEYIKDELERAGIEAVYEGLDKGEVPYTFVGKLYKEVLISSFDITFKRAWYYWMAFGYIPLALAEQMYRHPEGKKSVRVTGHCGCPPPEEPWIDWIAKDGRKLGKLSEWDKYKEDSVVWDLIVNKETMESKDGIYRWVGDPIKEGTPYITSYHIDSQAGLLLFAETLKGHLAKGRQ